MNCPEDKPCVWIASGPEVICGNCGRTQPPIDTHRAIRATLNNSVRAIEWSGRDYPNDK